MIHKIFVYGTLKQGKSNHFLLQGKMPILATAPNIELHTGPDYPFAIHGTGCTQGEVYTVDDALLQQLDELERHPHYYCRELVPVILANGKSVEAWIYLHPNARHYPLVENGSW